MFEESEASSLDTQVDNVDPPGSHHAFCPTCQMWLNGPTQWEDHRIGKTHLKNTRRDRRGGGTAVAPVLSISSNASTTAGRAQAAIVAPSRPRPSRDSGSSSAQAGRAQAETVAPAAAGHPATMTCSEKLEHQHIAGDGNQSKTVKGKYKRRKKDGKYKRRKRDGQAFSDSGYPYDAGMGESRPAYLEIGPLQ